MPLPGDITTIVLTGTYLDMLGNARSGTVTFTPSTPMLVDASASTILGGAPITVALTSGAFSVTLPCRSGLAPSGWVWYVTEAVSGSVQRTYAIALPHALGSIVDISALTPVVATGASTPCLLASQLGAASGPAQLNGSGYLPLTEGGTGAGTAAGALASLGATPASQSFALANSAYKDILTWTVTGQSDDPLPPFGWVSGSQTYSWYSGGETTQGPAIWQGYNPRRLSGQPKASLSAAEQNHASIGYSLFGDAGDTWNPATGGHGLEANWGCWLSPDGTKGVNAIEVVGADDNTGTVTLALRCGTGSFTSHAGSLYGSGISMSDTGGNSYMTAGPFNNLVSYNGGSGPNTQPGIMFGAPVALSNLWYLEGQSPGSMTFLLETAGAAGSGALSVSAISASDTVTSLWEAGLANSFSILSGTGAASLTVAAASSGSASVTVTGNGSGNTASLSLASAGAASLAASSSAGSAALTLTAQGTGSLATAAIHSFSGTAQFILNGNSSVSAQMVWQKNGSNIWVMQDGGGSSLYLTNNSGNTQMLMTSGNNATDYNAAQTNFLSQVFAYGSMVVNNGGTALANSATAGFLYIPAVAGTPTGTPAAQAGSVPICYDTTSNKIWAYNGSWAGVTV